MKNHEWVEEFPASVTVTDLDGIIIAMNAKAASIFPADSGRNLVGKSVYDCHPPAAQAKLKELL